MTGLEGATALVTFPDHFATMTRDALCEQMPRVLTEPNELLTKMVGAFFVLPQAGKR